MQTSAPPSSSIAPPAVAQQVACRRQNAGRSYLPGKSRVAEKTLRNVDALARFEPPGGFDRGLRGGQRVLDGAQPARILRVPGRGVVAVTILVADVGSGQNRFLRAGPPVILGK